MEIKIGQLIDADAKRDAVHVAIAPVAANERLLPGQPVGVFGINLATGAGPHVGIIDPFLTATVEPGQRCWLFMLPNTVTGLRHQWDHPAFAEPVAPAPPVPEKTPMQAVQEALARLQKENERLVQEAADDDGCRGC